MIKVYALFLVTFLSGSALVAAARTSDSAQNIPSSQSNDQVAQCEQPKEYFVTIESTRVRYVEAGAGPPVVLIHGNAGSVYDYDFKSLDPLCRDHMVIAVDRPGHGKSERPDGSAATLQFQTRLLHETLSYLGIVRPVI